MGPYFAFINFTAQNILEKTPLQLPTTVTEAILHTSGLAGEALQYVLDYARWDIEKPTFCNIEAQRIAAIHLEAIQ